MKYAVEVVACAITHTPSFIKIGSAIQKLVGEETETHTDSMEIA
jgi:hypothetical protein